MEASEYERMSTFEDIHWWFVGRRQVVDAFLRRLPLPRRSLSILEVGCGSGGNFEMLSAFGALKAVEMNEGARTKAIARGLAKQVENAQLPDQMPYKGEQFDVVAMFDVLEHIEQDVESLRVLRDYVKTDGQLCLTVPAFPALWSSRDRLNHHKRRYTRSSLTRTVCAAGFKPVYTSYFNFWLFPLIAPILLLQRWSGAPLPISNIVLPSSFANRLLIAIFGSEKHMVGKCRLPFGISLIMNATVA